MFKVPIEKLNFVLNNFGIKKAWHSILATHIYALGQSRFDYILKQKEFVGVPFQDFDLINDLSIGEISALYEYSLVYADRNKRKNEGQFFTPDDVAILMAKKALTFPENKIWIDPCSGIGNLSYWLIKLQKKSELFLKNNIYLIDRDPLALFIARVLFAINFQNQFPRLFIDIAPKFVVADFLSGNNLPQFDYAILNPPYVGVEPNYAFNTAEARDLYAYFLERVIKSANGFVSISPQTFTHSPRFRSLRHVLLDNIKYLSIYCFDNVPDNIFRGVKFGSINTNKVNSTRAAIIVAKSKGKNFSFKITPLLRWRTKERAIMLDSVDKYLTNIEPSAEIFPKIQKELLPFYLKMKKNQKYLLHLVSRGPTKYRLIVPSTPRYFISALKTEVKRSSFKTLYFRDQKNYDLAYLLLNSSYIYWWWRINDGGMTISEKTLLTLPVPEDIIIDSELIAKIENSEFTNKVVKRNAGKDNENVKHDPGLVTSINKKLFPKFVSALSLLHNNSVI